jgi:hypothetical protein
MSFTAVGCNVVGLFVTGFLVVGCNVTGRLVVGFRVTGRCVVGLAVIGGLVVGCDVTGVLVLVPMYPNRWKWSYKLVTTFDHLLSIAMHSVSVTLSRFSSEKSLKGMNDFLGVVLEPAPVCRNVWQNSGNPLTVLLVDETAVKESDPVSVPLILLHTAVANVTRRVRGSSKKDGRSCTLTCILESLSDAIPPLSTIVLSLFVSF